MGLLDRFRFRARALRRAELESEFDEELAFHVERQAREYIARGRDPIKARAAAARELGMPLGIKEELREARGLHLVDTMRQDLRHGLRLMVRTPGFTSAAVLTIALAIGATTTVFSVVYGIVLSPLPYPAAGRLVNIWSSVPEMGLPRAFVGPANFRDWRDQNDVFQDMALVRHIANFTLSGDGEPERLQGARVTASLFRVLEVQPVLGRAFTDSEEQPGQDRSVILSHGLWTRRFGQDPDVIGRAIRLSGVPYVIVGVMGPEFAYPGREFQLWVPLTINPDDYATRLEYSFLCIARLKRGVTVDRAQQQMTTISARLARQYAANRGVGAIVASMQGDIVGDVRTPLLVLLGAVTGLLLIGCASLANLLIARAVSRSGELVLRSALGARRGRLVRQSLTELLPILASGGAAGVALAYGALGAVVPWLPPNMPRVEAIGINGAVLAFASAALALTAVAIGIWPALQVAGWDLAASLRDSLRGASTTLRGGRVRDVLVVAQIAVAVTLLVASTLLMRSFAGIKRIDPGFRPEGVVSLHLAIPRAKYQDDAQVAAVSRDIVRQVQQLPGVSAAGMVNRLPLGGGAQTAPVACEGSTTIDLQRGTNADLRTVTPDYFRTMGIPLVAGRAFTEADTADAAGVAIIDDRLAARAWPGRSPLGRRMRIAVADQPWLTIVGVVGHVKHDGLTTDQRSQVYWNYLQRTQDRMALVVRGAGDTAIVTRSVIAAIHQVDPEQAVYDVRPMTAVLDRSVAQQWLTTTVLSVFALVALVVAAVGVYGVVAFGVSQRAREFAVRLALGAERRDVLRMVLHRGAALVGAGVLGGIVTALAASQVIGTLLYGVEPTDWVSYAAAAAALATIAFIATWLPARRAARLDPIRVLRSE